ncbi:lysine--tRNA ligase [soil metagenome]
MAAAGGDAAPSIDVHHLEAQRRANRDQAARELGIGPYGEKIDGVLDLSAARARYDAAADAEHAAAQAALKITAKEPTGGGPSANAAPAPDPRPMVTIAGRVVLSRDNGKLIWMTLRDDTGDLQVACSQKDCVEGGGFALAKLTDRGDIVVARGPLMKTKTGEVTVWARSLEAAAKCLVPPPEKHAGLADVELRYRQRYVDMWSSPETTRVLRLRSTIVSGVRAFMLARGYLEVETPMLQSLAGGAAARPFITKMNALDMDLFMRIAPELYLKRLLVGGLPRVFEINRNFRNEGLDKQHNPEFTMLEAYCAFGDVETVMTLTEDLVRAAARMVEDSLRTHPAAATGESGANAAGGAAAAEHQRVLHLPFGEFSINYADPFVRVAYGELFERALGFGMDDEARVRRTANERRRRTQTPAGQPISTVLIVNDLFEEFAEKTVDPARPTFITHYPAAISPLTRPNRANPALADRADLFIGGMEIAPHYTELNDPDVQAAKFREQLQGADEGKSAEEQTFRTFDEDFINALKVGMPPAGGMGLGIDRLVMLLTNQRTIRDVILFPLMRPEAK